MLRKFEGIRVEVQHNLLDALFVLDDLVVVAEPFEEYFHVNLLDGCLVSQNVNNLLDRILQVEVGVEPLELVSSDSSEVQHAVNLMQQQLR